MKFLALYVGTATDDQKAAMSEEESNVLMADWGRWMDEHRAAIVDPGMPLGDTRRVAQDGTSPARNNYVGYTIVEAASHDKAAAMFATHPILRLLPGNAVEVMTCPDLPGM